MTDVLHTYRKSIENIDAALVRLLAERFKVIYALGIRRNLGSELHALYDIDWSIDRLRCLAEEARLDPAFCERFFSFLEHEVINDIDQRRLAGLQQGCECAPNR